MFRSLTFIPLLALERNGMVFSAFFCMKFIIAILSILLALRWLLFNCFFGNFEVDALFIVLKIS